MKNRERGRSGRGIGIGNCTSGSISISSCDGGDGGGGGGSCSCCCSRSEGRVNQAKLVLRHLFDSLWHGRCWGILKLGRHGSPDKAQVSIPAAAAAHGTASGGGGCELSLNGFAACEQVARTKRGPPESQAIESRRMRSLSSVRSA